jgi:UDP-glucose 4-epimerase
MSRGFEKAFDALSTTFPKDFAFELVDLGNADAIDQVFCKCRMSVVIHLAALAFMGKSVKFPGLHCQNITVNKLLADKMLFHNVNRRVCGQQWNWQLAWNAGGRTCT